MKAFEKNITESKSCQNGKPFFQPKPAVNESGDKYEQESDFMADKIIQSKSVLSGEQFFKPAYQVQNKIQRQEKEPETEEEKKESTTIPDEVDSRVDYFEMTRPFYSRGAASMLYFDDRIGRSIGNAWDNNYNLFFNFGFGDSLSADASNFFTPFTIDSALKHDYPSASEIFEKDADISSIVLSPTIFSFDVHDIPGTLRLPFLSIFGADKSNPYTQKKVQRKCKDCEGEEVQRKEINSGNISGGNEFESYVGNLNSSGKALGSKERNFFEPRFNNDFSDVRIHTDSKAAESAQSINALAYTSGKNIVFNENQYSPETDSGKKLLAHELTHVVQQNNDIQPKKIQRKVVVNPSGETKYAAGLMSQICDNNVKYKDDKITSDCDSVSKSSNSCDCICDVTSDPKRTYTINVKPQTATVKSEKLWDGTTAKIPSATPYPHTNRGTNPSVTIHSQSGRSVEFGTFNPSGNIFYFPDWRILAHELCGHARLDQSQGGPTGNRPPHDDTIDVENDIAIEHGPLEMRGHYSDRRQGESFWNPVGNNSKIAFKQKNGMHFEAP